MLPSRKELKERYTQWSNKELLFVLHHKHQYTPEAADVARAELGQRKITPEEVDRFLADLEHERNTRKILSSVSLTFFEKIRCFFLWFVPNLSLANRGFLLKEKQARTYALAGYVCFFVSAFIVIHFHLPYLLMAGLLPLLFAIFYWWERQYGSKNLDALR